MMKVMMKLMMVKYRRIRTWVDFGRVFRQAILPSILNLAFESSVVLFVTIFAFSPGSWRGRVCQMSAQCWGEIDFFEKFHQQSKKIKIPYRLGPI